MSDVERKTRVKSYGPNLNEHELSLACEWENCSSILNEMKVFLEHVNDHLQAATHLECKWRACEAIPFDTREAYERHIRFHAFHTKLKQIGLCVLNNYNKSNTIKIKTCSLTNQTLNIIPDLPYAFECAWGTCALSSNNPEEFYAHCKSHYDDFKNKYTQMPSCLWTNCTHKIANRNRLIEHLRSHTQEKQCACFVCGTLFGTYGKFIDHCSRSTPNDSETNTMIKYQCSHCNKKFLTNSLLREHIRKHINNVKCTLCEMTCINTTDLRKHMTYKHSNERNFKCEHCDCAYKSHGDLTRHVNSSHNLAINISTQTQLKCTKKISNCNYQCHICQSTYSHGSTLSSHLRNVHKFKWPSGHSRFHYRLDNDGFYRLQTVRYESVELMEKLNQEKQQMSTHQEDSYVIQQL